MSEASEGTRPKPPVAIFLGAGSSKAYGFPLTSEIFPAIRRGIEDGTLFSESFFSLFSHEDSRRELHEYLVELLPGFDDGALQLPLVTDILSLIDYSLQVSTVPMRGRTAADLERFRGLLEQAIFDVLWPPYKEQEAPLLLRRLARRIHRLSRENHVGLITSNYDMALDEQLRRLYRNEGVEDRFDFGFAWRDPSTGRLRARPTVPDYSIFKLHGSVNWLRCDVCDHVYINLWGPIGGWGYRASAAIGGEAVEDQYRDNSTCHCAHTPLRPVLVAPSFVRDIRDVNVLETWKHALELLRTAGRWIIIGYSFPPEDLAIRSMFIRAYNARDGRPEITVVQKDGDDPRANAATRSRYDLIFPGCTYLTGGLEEFLGAAPGPDEADADDAGNVPPEPGRPWIESNMVPGRS